MSFLLIGKLIKPFGLKGDLKVDFYVDDPDELSQMGEFYVADKRSASGYKPIDVEWLKEQGGRFIIKLAEVNDRDQAELWREKELFVDEALVPSADDDEFFIKDIMNCEVYYRGELIGTVSNVLNIADQSMLIVKQPDRKEIVVPFQEHYVGDIDPDRNRIEVFHLDELN